MQSTFNPFSIAILVICFIGYTAIFFEKNIGIQRASSALMMGIGTWIIQFANPYISHAENEIFLGEHLAYITQVVLFVLAGLIIVETIQTYNGFSFLSSFLNIRSKKKVFWLVSLFSFFLSSVFDNVTAALVMATLISKITKEREDRLILGASMVVAVNCGGLWSPIGDVTTLLLWIGNRVEIRHLFEILFIPSVIACVVSNFFLSRRLKGVFPFYVASFEDKMDLDHPWGRGMFFLGGACLLLAPVLHITTGLPPFMGILLGVSLLWFFTDFLHPQEEHAHLKVPHILTRVDYSFIIFFIGILLTVDALATSGLFSLFAETLNSFEMPYEVMALLIGGICAVFDNIPVVAGTMAIYDPLYVPHDALFWYMLAYVSGVGGNLLTLGSAAGILWVGIENVSLGWYVKNVLFAALMGYAAGFIWFLL